MNRPYLLLPHLIPQPTWGGDYITTQKSLSGGQKIGQSYELSKQSLLATNITSSKELIEELSALGGKVDTIPITEFEQSPLLIKLNQARGNSFQLHIKPEENDPFWKPKPESWYFLEDGYISLGIQENIDIDRYKSICVEIDGYMHELSKSVRTGNTTLETARARASEFVKDKNPWQFVNVHRVKKHTVVDLSMGGIHHSWEDDGGVLGNIVFEVQLEATDDEATIRAFDQGKIKDDGTVRTLQVEDYFAHLDTRSETNNFDMLTKRNAPDLLLSSPYYVVEELLVTQKKTVVVEGSYMHIFVREGSVQVSGGGVNVMVEKMHSCFLPGGDGDFEIASNSPESTILITRPKF